MQQVTAGKASLKLVTEGYDPAMLQELLNHVTSNPVEVSDGTLSFDEADGDAIASTLAEIGIETTAAEPVVAVEEEPAPAEPAAAPAATEEEPVAPVTASAPASEEAPVTEEALYDQAETELNASGSYQGLLCGSGEKASWLLVSGAGKPVARIVLAKQESAPQLAGIFASPQYFDMVKAAFEKKGIKATLQSVKAEIFTDKEVAPAEQPDVVEIQASAIERYRRNLSMAVVAAQKNLIPNRMKAAAFEVLNEAGVEDPESVVEAVFAAADEMFDDLDKQAAEYSQMDESGIAATQKVLASMQVQPIGTRGSAAASQMRARLAATNMPLTAALGELPVAPKDEPKQTVAGLDRSLVTAALRKL